MNKVHVYLFLFFLFGWSSISTLEAQVIEAAYSEWDDQFEEYKIHINEEEYVEAIRQFGSNPYRRWNLRFENLDGGYYSGYMQLKREGDINYWDFNFDNEFLSIETIYRNDVFTWRIRQGELSFTFSAQDRFGYVWEDRFMKEFDWLMYQVEEGDIRDWYIDDDSDDALSFPMRIAAVLIILEINAFGAG